MLCAIVEGLRNEYKNMIDTQEILIIHKALLLVLFIYLPLFELTLSDFLFIYLIPKIFRNRMHPKAHVKYRRLIFSETLVFSFKVYAIPEYPIPSKMTFLGAKASKSNNSSNLFNFHFYWLCKPILNKLSIKFEWGG